MKLHLFNFHCQSCGASYQSPLLVGNAYGEFLLRDKKGNIAYLNAMNSVPFKEFSDFIKQNKFLKNSKLITQAKVAHHIFGAACDKSSDDSTYQITQKPICPECGDINVGKWGPTNPPEFVDQDIRNITHQCWDMLSFIEKRDLVNSEVKKYLSQNS